MTDDETAMLLLQFFEALEQFELLGEAATLMFLCLPENASQQREQDGTGGNGVE